MDKIFGIARFSIHPGKEQEFRQAAAACVNASRANLAGTGAYEWFITPDGANCTVIESYDGADGLWSHMRQLAAVGAKLVETSSSEVLLLGDVSKEVLAKLSRMKVSFFGRRILGRLNSPGAPDGSVSDGGIFAIARFKPHAGMTARFKQLAAECFAAVEAREPDTIAYEWFANADESEFFVLDIYRNSGALPLHASNVGKIMRELMTTAQRQVELFGGVDAETQAAFAARSMPFIAPRFQGVL